MSARFKVERVGVPDDSYSPHPKAVRTVSDEWHKRTCTEEVYDEKFSAREGGRWRERGHDHGTWELDDYARRHGVGNPEGTGIKRLEPRTIWTIHVASVEDLQNLWPGETITIEPATPPELPLLKIGTPEC